MGTFETKKLLRHGDCKETLADSNGGGETLQGIEDAYLVKLKTLI